MKSLSDETLAQYHAIVRGCGWARLANRSMIVVTGADRVSFLHNLGTADIKKLNPGEGSEIFLTSVQGKILGFGYVFCETDRLVLDTSPEQASAIISHLDRYLITEDVKLADETNQIVEFLLAGPESPAIVKQISGHEPPADRCAHQPSMVGETDVSVRRVDFTCSECYFLSCRAGDAAVVHAALEAVGVTSCDTEAVEVARIEHGTPVYGRDITSDNLPQEVDRDARAISFTKGCYLGQETVARIDALGHVNWKLRQIRLPSGGNPIAGTELTSAGKKAGWLTSIVFSAKLNAPLALGYVKSQLASVGSKVETNLGEIEIVELC